MTHINQKIMTVVFLVLLCTSAYALRVPKPPTLTEPLKEDNISQLNKYLESVWHMQYGRYELDIVTSPKTKANNGEMWLVQTGQVIRVQYMGNGHIFTITPDGY
jgi:hypothetical protein